VSTHHAMALATCSSGERAARHARAHYGRRRWRFGVYPQEPDRREAWREEARCPGVSSRSVSQSWFTAFSVVFAVPCFDAPERSVDAYLT